VSRILFFLILIAFAAWGLHGLADNPGNIILNWQGYHIQTSLGVGLFAILLLTLIIALVWTLLRTLLNLPRLFSLRRKGRREHLGLKALSTGLIAMGAGDVPTAQKAVKEAIRFLGDQPLTLLLKAQTAQITGNRAQAESVFQTMSEHPETQVLGLRGLYVEAHRRGDRANALLYAQKAVSLAPSAQWAHEATLTHACVEQRWRDALLLVDQEAKRGTQNKRIRSALLTAEAIRLAPTAPESALTLLKDALALNPSLIPAIVQTAKIHIQNRHWRKAINTLQKGWQLAPHPAIAHTYIHLREGDAKGDSVEDHLDRAKHLLTLQPAHIEAHMALATTARKARQFALARASLNWLLAHQPTARVYHFAAQLEETETGHYEKSREWQAKASVAVPDPVWMADGHPLPTWLPYSPFSGRLDACEWGTPPLSLAHSPYAGITLSADEASTDVLADVDERASFQ
jgi:HemY protein